MDIAGLAIAVISAVAGIAGAYFAWVPVRKQLSRRRAARTPSPPGSGGTLEDGDVLDFGGGARVVGVPGHTDGSIADPLKVSWTATMLT